MESYWDNLHPSLLELILNRLPVSDYLRFPAVCPSWCRVQQVHRLRCGPSASQMPWLLLPEDKRSSQGRLFYNPSEQRYYRLPLPPTSVGRNHFRICSTPSGAAHGWLLFLEDKVLLLFNPFNRSEIRIPTPHFTNLGMDYYLATLSMSPTDPNCIVFLWYNNFFEECYYCRISDKNWKSVTTSKLLIQTEMLNFYMSIDPLAVVPTICEGKLYLSGGGSKIVIIELLSEPGKKCLKMSGLPTPVPDSMKYFVESDGQILLVNVIIEDGQVDSPKSFEIFKADLTQKTWVVMESLGDRVLFLGHGHSLCLPAVSTGVQENRIYFARSRKLLWIEYDYASHQVVRKISWGFNKNVEDSFNNDYLRWVVPRLC